MEQWKELRYNTEYLISNKGRIKRPSNRNKDFLMSTKHSSGYAMLVSIKLIDGTKKSFRVNKLVVEHFDKDYDWDKFDVVNLDGDNYNCSIDNLYIQLKTTYINRIYRVSKKAVRRRILNNYYKKCCTCKEYKLIHNFNWHSFYNNFRSDCIVCERRANTERMARWYKNKKKDPFFRLVFSFRHRTTQAIKQKGYTKKSKTKKMLGCEWEFLKEHLESQFTKGMTWDNYGEWHVDHIIPISMAATEEQLYKLSHYTNLQPLWGVENLAKNDKLPKDQIDKAKSLGLTIDYSKII